MAAKLAIVLPFVFFCACSLYNPDPHRLKASDGKHPGKIALSWNSPNPDDEEYSSPSPEVANYVVERQKAGEPMFSYLADSGTTSFDDETVIPGVRYTYRVLAEFVGGSQSGYSNEDDGFAMDAVAFQITATPAEYPLVGAAGMPDTAWDWYEFLAQEGWTYTIETTQASVVVDTQIELYKHPNIAGPIRSDDDGGTLPFSKLTWTCTDTELYYLKVLADISDDYTVTIWHH